LNEDKLQSGTVSLYLRSLVFWIVFAFLILIFTTLLVLSFPFPPEKRFVVTRAWSRSVLWWLQLTCNLRYEIKGTENVPDKPGIVFSKHQSTWETIALQTIFPLQVWVAKRELLWLPFFGWGLALMKCIAIKRGTGRAAIKQLVQQGKARLDEGISVMIFPEGTRTDFGTEAQYRPGGAILASQSGYPVVPIAHNAGYYWPRHQFHKKPGTIKVVIGKPIETKGKTSHEVIHEVKEWIENEMERISVGLPHP